MGDRHTHFMAESKTNPQKVVFCVHTSLYSIPKYSTSLPSCHVPWTEQRWASHLGIWEDGCHGMQWSCTLWEWVATMRLCQKEKNSEPVQMWPWGISCTLKIGILQDYSQKPDHRPDLWQCPWGLTFWACMLVSMQLKNCKKHLIGKAWLT